MLEAIEMLIPIMAIGTNGYVVYSCIKHIIKRAKNERAKHNITRNK